jgi:ABC-2 type transport system ATP-binding protein
VLFLDEPTVGLDPRIRAELLDVIAGLRSRGELTVLLTTHYLDEAERLCDRVAIMHSGRIVALDTPQNLLADLGRELVEMRIAGDVERALASLRERGVAGDDAFAVGSRLTVPLHDRSSREAIAAVHELGLAAAISAREPTLDDVYLRLTGDSLAAAA